jgi:hypothetical protein
LWKCAGEDSSCAEGADCEGQQKYLHSSIFAAVLLALMQRNPAMRRNGEVMSYIQI